MTGRIGALSVENSLVSPTESARIEAEEALHAQAQRRAARVVAAASRDLADCRALLDALGLSRAVVEAARAEHTHRSDRAKSGSHAA